jgi:hypothetical protein
MPDRQIMSASELRRQWRILWRYVAGLFLVCVLGWFAFVQDVRVPLLGYADLGVHELGHMLFTPFPDFVTAIMGNGFQVLVPLLFAIWFLAGQKDLLGVAVCLTWAGTCAQDASVYIADAPTQGLALIGGEHDWAYVLGEHFHALDSASTIAAIVRGTGGVLFTMSLVICLYATLHGIERGSLSPASST